jgi:hypothetical protein
VPKIRFCISICFVCTIAKFSKKNKEEKISFAYGSERGDSIVDSASEFGRQFLKQYLADEYHLLMLISDNDT